MPDDKNLDDLSIDEINELFNSVIEGPDEWKIASGPLSPGDFNLGKDSYCGGVGCYYM